MSDVGEGRPPVKECVPFQDMNRLVVWDVRHPTAVKF